MIKIFIYFKTRKKKGIVKLSISKYVNAFFSILLFTSNIPLMYHTKKKINVFGHYYV